MTTNGPGVDIYNTYKPGAYFPISADPLGYYQISTKPIWDPLNIWPERTAVTTTTVTTPTCPAYDTVMPMTIQTTTQEIQQIYAVAASQIQTSVNEAKAQISTELGNLNTRAQAACHSREARLHVNARIEQVRRDFSNSLNESPRNRAAHEKARNQLNDALNDIETRLRQDGVLHATAETIVNQARERINAYLAESAAEVNIARANAEIRLNNANSVIAKSTADEIRNSLSTVQNNAIGTLPANHPAIREIRAYIAKAQNDISNSLHSGTNNPRLTAENVNRYLDRVHEDVERMLLANNVDAARASAVTYCSRDSSRYTLGHYQTAVESAHNAAINLGI